MLGVSGGIDSTVVAYLAVNALGKDKLHGIIMPYVRNQNMDDGLELSQKLGIPHEVIEIKDLVDAYGKIDFFNNKVAKGNLMARIRMCLLYGKANKDNLMVLGTSNKTEIMLGYFTKYGDGGVDILPIGGLLKNEVRSLAKELKIPTQITNKTPSAGLWEGQTDEGEMGFSYEELDKAIISIESGDSKKDNSRRRRIKTSKV